jgi:hypothetical protein
VSSKLVCFSSQQSFLSVCLFVCCNLFPSPEDWMSDDENVIWFDQKK